MNEFQYMHELQHQNILNDYFITQKIFQNYVKDEVNNNNKTHKQKIKLLEVLKFHNIKINNFKSRNNLY